VERRDLAGIAVEKSVFWGYFAARLMFLKSSQAK
jgi:hypothetical protein